MSLRAMAAVWELNLPTQTEKLVLLALADHADDDGFCYPGRKYVARKCGITDRHVTRLFNHFQELGILEINEQHKDNGGQKSNLYRLLIPSSFDPLDSRVSTPLDSRVYPPLDSVKSTPPWTQLSPPPLDSVESTPLNKVDPSVEPSTERARAGKNPPIDPKGSSDLRAIAIDSANGQDKVHACATPTGFGFDDDDDDIRDIRSSDMVKGLKEAIERNPDDKVLCRWYDVLINIDLPPFTIFTWFKPFTPIKLVRGVLTIATESKFNYDWCRGHFLEELSAMKVEIRLSGEVEGGEVKAEEVADSKVEGSEVEHPARSKVARSKPARSKPARSKPERSKNEQSQNASKPC